MCEANHLPVALFAVFALAVVGCGQGGAVNDDHGDHHGHGHTPGDHQPREHTPGPAQGHPGPAMGPHGDKPAPAATGWDPPAPLTLGDSLVVTDGVSLPGGKTLFLVLNPSPAGEGSGSAQKSLVLFLARPDGQTQPTGSWTVAAMAKLDRRETHLYGDGEVEINIRDREGRPPIRVKGGVVHQGPTGFEGRIVRDGSSGTRFQRRFAGVQAGSMLLAMNRLWRLTAASQPWKVEVDRQAFLTVGLRTPAPRGVGDVAGSWRSMSLSGPGERTAWTLGTGSYTAHAEAPGTGETGTGSRGTYAEAEPGWTAFTPEGTEDRRIYALLDAAGGFGLAFHAGLSPEGVPQAGDGVYDGVSFWWRDDAPPPADVDISGPWRVFGRLLVPEAAGGGTTAEGTENYGGQVEIDRDGALSGTMGYWGSAPWITLTGSISVAARPSGSLQLEIPFGLRSRGAPVPDPGTASGPDRRAAQPFAHGHPHPPGGATHQ